MAVLTIDQALADAAMFIQKMNDHYEFVSTQKWIIFGGSYAGALAMWLVELYPSIAYGAISSSATVKATMNFRQFFENVSKSFVLKSLDCANAIEKGFTQLRAMMMESSTKGNELQKILT